MAKKNISSKKGKESKTVLTKIAGKVGYLAGEIAGGKDHLIEMAGDAVKSIKTAIHDITAKKKVPPKRAPKPTAKKTATKPPAAVAKKTVKKIAPKVSAAAKKTAKKTTPKK